MKERWPEALDFQASAASNFEQLQALISEIRLVAAELPIKDGHTLLYKDDGLIEGNSDLIKHLARLKGIERVEEPRGLRLAISGHLAWLDIDEKTLVKYREALTGRLKAAQERVKALQSRLENETYISKAPAHLVEESKVQLAEQKTLITRLQKELAVTITD